MLALAFLTGLKRGVGYCTIPIFACSQEHYVHSKKKKKNSKNAEQVKLTAGKESRRKNSVSC